jgi:hypothetical protein
MGEQPGPVDDELERALVSMRVGFLSGSTQIATDVRALDEALVDAPDNERETVRAAVSQIVNTQARLTSRMETLPTAAWDRFKIMVSVVKAQQAVLDQLGDLVQKHVLPRQIDNLSISPFPEASPPPAFVDDAPPFPSSTPFPDDPPPPTFGETFPDDPPPPAYEPAPPRGGESFMRAQQGLQALDAQRTHAAHRGRSRRQSDDEDDEERQSFVSRLRERTASYRGLAAMIATAVVLALVPGETRHRLQDFASRMVDMVTAVTEMRPSAESRTAGEAPRSPSAGSQASEATRRPAETNAPRGGSEIAARAPERVPERPPERLPERAPERLQERAPPQPAAAPAPPPPAQKPQPRPVPAAAPAPAPAPPASGLQPDELQPGAAEAAPPPAQTAAAAPTASPERSESGEEQFVPVLFTHKNYDTVMQAMTDLKQRFPNILIGRKGEVLQVDLGKKGIFHRLVFLPAVPKPEATRLCDQLMAQGYDRCWVKEY